MYPRHMFFGLLHAPPPANSPLNKPTIKKIQVESNQSVATYFVKVLLPYTSEIGRKMTIPTHGNIEYKTQSHTQI